MKTKDKNISMENTLFLGNGFSRAVFKDIPAWKDLFKEDKSAIQDYTFLYEKSVLGYSSGLEDNKLKEEILQKINLSLCKDNINMKINDIGQFGEYLRKNEVYNIITTNYDNGIECILCDICSYEKEETPDLKEENIYNVRTYRKFVNHKTNHAVKLWKIHGDASRIMSITLGFDQYCGFLAKLSEYLKGKYKSDKGVVCKDDMREKCRTGNFDNLSWAELFFNTNVYIVGFGLDFSEIDVWWLLNKRARFMKEIPNISNTVCYLYDELYDDREEKSDIFEALDIFSVKYLGIKSDSNYIKSIFGQMQS